MYDYCRLLDLMGPEVLTLHSVCWRIAAQILCQAKPDTIAEILLNSRGILGLL